MEPEGSSPYSQEPAICPYPEHLLFLKFIISKIETTKKNKGTGYIGPMIYHKKDNQRRTTFLTMIMMICLLIPVICNIYKTKFAETKIKWTPPPNIINIYSTFSAANIAM
jgi:hypothetical protein